MEADPRRKVELSIPIIAYPETLWKKQYRVCMFVVLALLLMLPEFTIVVVIVRILCLAGRTEHTSIFDCLFSDSTDREIHGTQTRKENRVRAIMSESACCEHGKTKLGPVKNCLTKSFTTRS